MTSRKFTGTVQEGYVEPLMVMFYPVAKGEDQRPHISRGALIPAELAEHHGLTVGQTISGTYEPFSLANGGNPSEVLEVIELHVEGSGEPFVSTEPDGMLESESGFGCDLSGGP